MKKSIWIGIIVFSIIIIGLFLFSGGSYSEVLVNDYNTRTSQLEKDLSEINSEINVFNEIEDYNRRQEKGKDIILGYDLYLNHLNSFKVFLTDNREDLEFVFEINVAQKVTAVQDEIIIIESTKKQLKEILVDEENSNQIGFLEILSSLL